MEWGLYDSDSFPSRDECHSFVPTRFDLACALYPSVQSIVLMAVGQRIGFGGVAYPPLVMVPRQWKKSLLKKSNDKPHHACTTKVLKTVNDGR